MVIIDNSGALFYRVIVLDGVALVWIFSENFFFPCEAVGFFQRNPPQWIAMVWLHRLLVIVGLDLVATEN